MASRRSIQLADLRQENLLCLDQKTGLFSLCTQLCLDAGFQPHFVYTGHRPENIVGLAAQGMGIALLMQRHTDYVRCPDVVTIDIAPQVESSICLVRLKDVHQRLGSKLLGFVQDELCRSPDNMVFPPGINPRENGIAPRNAP